MESGVGKRVQLHLRNTRREHSANVLDVGGILIKIRTNSLKILGKISGNVPEDILDELSLIQTDSILIMGEASPVIIHLRYCRHCWPMDCGCFL